MTKAEKRAKERSVKKIASTLLNYAPNAVERLCKILEDEDTPSSTALSAAKEILERSVGKGILCEVLPDEDKKEFVFILKVVE